VLAGRFRIIRCLGRGSFGTVYEAEDLQLHERVALKLLRPEVRSSPSLLGHLHHEIVVGRRISHPNVCRIHDLGTSGDMHFISMALVPGESLDRILEKGAPSAETALQILLQIASALEAAHAQGVVHRDLKPSNIMVHTEESGAAMDPGGAPRVTVLDFGLSRDLRAGPSLSGALIGSPAYWSPEQARGDRATERSDIYTLGLIACDLFGMKRPTFGEVGHLGPVPAAYRGAVERCLCPRPEDRFASAREIREALLSAQRRPRRRQRRILVVAVAVFAAAAGGVAVFLATTHRAELPGTASSGAGTRAPRDTNRPPSTSARVAPGVPALSGGSFDAGAAPRVTATGHIAIRRPSRLPSRAAQAVVLPKTTAPEPHTATREPPPAPAVPAVAPAARPRDGGPSESLLRALAAFRERLRKLETERRRRGILLDDAPQLRTQVDEARRACRGADEVAARTAVSHLAESLQQVRVDRAFVSRKLERLSRVKDSLRLDDATNKTVAAIFAKVHDRFFSGDYEGANAQLNAIGRVLGRGE
jgi:hypothetical protein